MARVTVEDCILKVSNRFELVMLAAQRARDIGAGAHLTVDRDNDKSPVIALREIAEGTISVGDLKDAFVRDRQRITQEDEPDDEVIELMAGEEELYAQASADEIFSADSDDGSGVDVDSVEVSSVDEDEPLSAVVDDDAEISEDDLLSDDDTGRS